MQISKSLFTIWLLAGLYSCGGGGGSSNPNLPTVTAVLESITITGTIMDGPVTGGRYFVFDADDINTALELANSAEDRASALQDAAPLASAVRSETDGDAFSIEIPGINADRPVFIVFDSTGAVDETFGDQPVDMETVLVLGAAGSTATANITPHTSMIATQVRAALSTGSSASLVSNEIIGATANVIAALGTDELGNVLFEVGTDIVSSTDLENLELASTFIGALVRSTAAITGKSIRDVLLAMGADSADGDVDGSVPAGLDFSDEIIDNAAEIAHRATAGRLDFVVTGGSCSVAANVLSKACEFDVLDDFLEGKAICQNTDDEVEFTECLAEVSDEVDENTEECEAVHEARLVLCEGLDDAPHTPQFGEDFAGNFVDPRNIGTSVQPNPWFPLLAGNTWVYESTFLEDEEDVAPGAEAELITEVITVIVTNKIKLIAGIPCLVVIDQVVEDGVLIENTDDWYAQDIGGNIWYCGEIAENFERFEEDDPATPELVDIEGSWKHGRDTAEAGILLPFEPEVGEFFRQEVLYGEAEDAIEILSLVGDESAGLFNCESGCLVTSDFSPLEPDAVEHKYYISGIGLILETDPGTGNRVELQSFTPGTP